MSSLNNQFYQILKHAEHYNHSKRDYRDLCDSRKTDKIFSYSTFGSIKQTSVSLCNFLQEWYPDIKKVSQITQHHLWDYLYYKADNCNPTTIQKLKQHLTSLGIYASQKFSSVNIDEWDVATLPIKSTKTDYLRYKNGFSEEEVDALLNYAFAPRRWNLEAAIILATTIGLRIDEIYTQRVSDIHLESKGEHGFGYVNVTDPKHGRPRTIPLLSESDKDKLQSIINLSHTDKIITCSKDNLQRQLSKAKNSCEIYKAWQSWHALRKYYAQTTYDYFRQHKSRAETIDIVNDYLGHGRHQESKLATYVKNMW